MFMRRTSLIVADKDLLVQLDEFADSAVIGLKPTGHPHRAQIHQRQPL